MFYTANMFMWFLQGNYIQDDNGQIILKEKPVLSWEYDYIRYYNAEKVFGLTEGNDIPLTQEQCDELDSFIIEKRKQVGILKMFVDSQGNYLGLKNIEDPDLDPDVHSTVALAPPNGDDWIWNYEENQWKRQYFYKADNTYTRKDDPNAIGFTFEPKPEHPYFEYQLDLSTNTWVKIITEEALIKYKKEMTLELLCSYVKILSLDVDQPISIVNELKSLDLNQNAKLSIIENGMIDIETAFTIEDIEEIGDIVNIIVNTWTIE